MGLDLTAFLIEREIGDTCYARAIANLGNSTSSWHFEVGSDMIDGQALINCTRNHRQLQRIPERQITF